ncbi:battenin [Lingula anatina]|uniref:Battenin n=1 Tax=Lingula anatina TaxID=7574 RepID=A0A1S3H7D5_LINAN|nr:battenin [Lingula anatina]|eukprot:XP_013381913.1 battenin [Lingula anatina]
MPCESDSEENPPRLPPSKWTLRRNLVGFWLFGLCNNYPYVIMLSAAMTILHDNGLPSGDVQTNTSSNSSRHLHCNPIGTGAVLLADILPVIIIKATAPFFIHRVQYNVRVALVILFGAASFLTVAFSLEVWLSLLGVVFASVSGGLGELTFLQLTTFYDVHTVSAFASGTGGAGLFGALSYAGLRTAKVSPRNSILIMLVIPVAMAVAFYIILVKPPQLRGHCFGGREYSLLAPGQESSSYQESGKTGAAISRYTFKEKLFLIKPLLKYMVPLTLVYFAEYLINQGLYELVNFEDIWLTNDEQYEWYQMDYQLGVFISRSSGSFLPINRLWVLPILQFVNLGVFTSDAILRYMPSIWIVLVLIFWEGLLGGAAYVNTFRKIREEIPADHREFSLGVASLGDALGIAVAGMVSIPLHVILCDNV